MRKNDPDADADDADDDDETQIQEEVDYVAADIIQGDKRGRLQIGLDYSRLF